MRDGPLCIRPRRVADLDAAAQGRLAALAAEIRAAEPRIDNIAAFGVNVHKGCGAGPGFWFGDTVRRLLGADAVPTKRAAHSWSMLTQHAAELARTWERLVIKVPDSAGSEGNFIVHSSDVSHLCLQDVHDRLRELISNHGRGPGFPVLIEIWDANVLTSPSVQVWIPLPDHGPPVIEGLFDQVLSGEEASFTGAISADLPERFDQALCHGAMQLAKLFQQLGYFGRCSFDALITGANNAEAKIHWIECNARWGGVSIPMSLVNRLAGSGPAPRYVIMQNGIDPFRPVTFADAQAEFADMAHTPNLQTGVIFLSPNLMEAGAGTHVLSFGANDRLAADQARQVLRRLQLAD